MSESTIHSLRSTISTHGVDRELLDLVDAVATENPVAVTSSGDGPIALAAASDAGVAAYVRRHSISIALDAVDAQRLHDRYGWRLELAGQNTGYVQVNTDDLLRPGIQTLVADTLATAFVRSMAGPRGRPQPPSRPARERSAAAPAPKKRAAATAPQRGELCDIHFMEKSVDGTCPMCDE